MSEEEIFKTLEKACILDKNCYEVDCLLEKDLIAIRELIKLYKNQQKEIEEKTTILLAGAEKVKQLEKGNRSLMESRIKWKNRYYKEKAKNKDKIAELQTKLAIETIDNKYNQEERDEETIPRYKIREKIKEYDKWIEEGGDYTESLEAQRYALQELLEEK